MISNKQQVYSAARGTVLEVIPSTKETLPAVEPSDLIVTKVNVCSFA